MSGIFAYPNSNAEAQMTHAMWNALPPFDAEWEDEQERRLRRKEEQEKKFKDKQEQENDNESI